MARKKADTTQLVVWGIVGYVAYKMGFIDKAKDFVNTNLTPLIGSLAPGGTGGGIFGPGQPVYGDLAAMESANPNFRQQMLDWQYARAANGEYAGDWSAFRQFQAGIGAPDPGPNGPQLFYQNASVYSETRR